jgi:hypothetical protein
MRTGYCWKFYSATEARTRYIVSLQIHPIGSGRFAEAIRQMQFAHQINKISTKVLIRQLENGLKI